MKKKTILLFLIVVLLLPVTLSQAQAQAQDSSTGTGLFQDLGCGLPGICEWKMGKQAVTLWRYHPSPMRFQGQFPFSFQSICICSGNQELLPF